MVEYSYSRISVFEQCPLKFKFQYIDKEKPDLVQTIEAFLGSRVHEVLEKLYKDLQFKKKNSLEDLLEYYKKVWEKHFSEEIHFNRKEYSEENYFEMGKQYISDYFNRRKPFEDGKTIALEELMRFKVGAYFFQGYIDRLTKISSIHYEIHDYKTNMRAKEQEELDQDKQLALYSLAVKKKFPEAKKIDLVWHFLAADLEMRSTRTAEDLQELQNEVTELIQEIELSEKKNNFPFKVSALCDWCGFQRICPAKKHHFKIKELPKNKYLNEEGVKLVDSYEKIYSKKKSFNEEMDSELMEIKDAIILYAEKNSMEIIEGSEKQAKISRLNTISIPFKDSEERTELEELLKNSALWEKTSTIDSAKLQELLQTPNLDKKLSNQIRKYLEEKESIKITLSKKK